MEELKEPERILLSSTDERLNGIIERLTAGSTNLIHESHLLGYEDNRVLRHALHAKLGREAYERLPIKGWKR